MFVIMLLVHRRSIRFMSNESSCKVLMLSLSITEVPPLRNSTTYLLMTLQYCGLRFILLRCSLLILKGPLISPAYVDSTLTHQSTHRIAQIWNLLAVFDESDIFVDLRANAEDRFDIIVVYYTFIFSVKYISFFSISVVSQIR